MVCSNLGSVGEERHATPGCCCEPHIAVASEMMTSLRDQPLAREKYWEISLLVEPKIPTFCSSKILRTAKRLGKLKILLALLVVFRI